MPLTIWKPREYENEFRLSVAGGDFPAGFPINGDHAAPPYNRDTKVREVTRFTGKTYRYYRETGEFEITIPQGYVEPSDVQAGYLVTIDGYVYIIEDYEWTLTDQGYQCTISGRDLGGLLDRYIPTHRRVSGAIEAPQGSSIVAFMEKFFTSYFNVNHDINEKLPERCGWFRDSDRKLSSGWVALETDINEPDEVNEDSASVEIVSYGDVIRIMTGYHDMGYRFDVVYDENLGVHTVQLVIYKPFNDTDDDVLFRVGGRGVSGFYYSKETRDAINAAFVFVKSRWFTELGVGWKQTEEPENIQYFLPFERNGRNWADVANNWSGIAIDLGEVPAENDVAGGDAEKWVDKQLIDVYRAPIETAGFSYDNSGAYKFGEHFGIGSLISIADDYTGVGLTARLTGVVTSYDAGKAKEYDFVLGDKRLSQADKLKRRFSHIDRIIYSV